MARINIEDSLWKDFRFQELMIRVGSRHAAKGMIVELWSLAQEYWFPEKRYVPIEKIQEAGLQAVIDVGLAEQREGGGYFAVGTEKAFDWLFQKQEAGKLGGKASSAKRKRAGAKRVLADDNQASSKTNPLSSFLFSPSLNSNSNTPLPPKGLQAVWNENCGDLPKAETLNRDRERQAKARLAEKGDPTYWVEIVRAIAKNPFCRGDNDRGWVATFDYLLRPKTHVQISERLSAGPPKSQAQSVDDAMKAYEAEKARMQAEADAEWEARHA